MGQITLVVIMDSDLDIGLLSPNGDHDPELVTQIKNQGLPVSTQIQELIVGRYHINLNKVILLKHNNFILLQEPKRVRVFMIE